ncbi:MAG: cyclic dehypoxanthinyl futalosine synthase [Deltaproteobacteria bacterium]
MDVNRILTEVLSGRRMKSEEVRCLYENADLLDLAQAACKFRDKLRGNAPITFVIDRNINYTNICSCRCKFCAFYRDKDHPEAYIITETELMSKIEEAIELGASQLMIQGGLNEDLGLEYFEEMFRSIKARYDICIHSLTAPEIFHLARQAGLSIKDTLLRLQAAGLDSLPGGGAEVLDDEVRHYISPNKIKAAEWLDVMKNAHEIGMKTTATMMMGSIDRLEHRLHHLEQIRDLQDETGGFRAFIPWTYQPGNNELMGDKISSLQYLRFLALSRMYLDNIEHIQGSWVTQGKSIGQLSLFFGGDDLGSVMIEENVVRSAGTVYKMQKEEMIALIRDAGYTPALRNTEYEILQVY